ncbi:DUF2510 domain-containing protein [Phytoactinopolyspora limicola]|uniref:DUF2510 domain-containing protein n=1 Tax=Phytoactinopolyspora limicola TaxID=2715536 RepID=UPI00140D52EB|nr:DUF2510 domain-containing protein [Phytoactinopolyspora limicola]
MKQTHTHRRNPYTPGLVVLGLASLASGLLLVSGRQPWYTEVTALWPMLGAALVCLGVLAFLALLVAGMLVWQPTTTAARPAEPRAASTPPPGELVIRKSTPPGWYNDPFGSGERFFDGINWTDRTLPLPVSA